MGWINKIKNGAKMFMFSGDKPKTVVSKLAVYPSAQDLNENQIPDILEQTQVPQQKRKFFNMDKDITHDKHGNYVSTMTYPLPPLSWEKQQFEKNRRARNGKNKYL